MAPNKAILSLCECYDRIRRETKEAFALMRQAFPIGSQVLWSHGLHERTAIVVEHNPYFDNLRVRGVTGKEYWVDASKLARYMAKP
ncbi:hypothetical protein LCGC14_2080050 [marine sediment metagenome]|uniref:Uncharacterized protein n=1 Tax=marine sediment metagenome TaxID=412755 RepID=A0A0F9F380_9ZZZZ